MPATKAAQDQWFTGAIGRPMNPDNFAGLQCVDVADDYCIALFGSWQNTIRPGNAKDLFNNANPTFFTKTLNIPTNQSQIPSRGDIIIYGASRAVPEGHVAVVESADIYGCTVVQQDGYLQKPAFEARLPYVLPNGAACIGWLTPKLEPPKSLATVAQVQDAYMQILERPADQAGIDHYTRYTIDFVRADLQNSQEYRDLQARKAQAAQAAADAAQRQAAQQAEAQRIAEEQAAADRLKQQAQQQQQAVDAAKQTAAQVAALPLPPSIPPITKPTTTPSKNDLAKPSPVVLFLSAFLKALIDSRFNKKAD